jgi:hypothetical protein
MIFNNSVIFQRREVVHGDEQVIDAVVSNWRFRTGDRDA